MGHNSMNNSTKNGASNHGNTTIQSKDYDWVLPVVVVLAIFVLITFVFLVILLCQKQKRWLRTRKSRQSFDKSVEMVKFTSKTKSKRVGQNNCHPATIIQTTELPTQIVSNKLDASNTAAIGIIQNGQIKYSQRLQGVIEDTSNIDVYNNDYHRAVKQSLNDNFNKTVDNLSINVGASFTETIPCERRTTNFLNRGSSDDDGNNTDTASQKQDIGEKVCFYLNDMKIGPSVQGIDNLSFESYDNDSIQPTHYNVHTPGAHNHDFDVLYDRSVSAGVIGVDKMGKDDHKNQFDFKRQTSNCSAPAYSLASELTPTLSNSIGKYETVFNLPAVTDFDTEDNALSDSTRIQYPRKIPTIILTKDGDNDHFTRVGSDLSFYNSSSLESGISTDTFKKVDDDVFENDRQSFSHGIGWGEIQRPSSAPSRYLSGGNSYESIHEEYFKRSQSGGGLNHFGNKLLPPPIDLTSRSWSSEFFEFIREAGITDSKTQDRIKKMIDDRYKILFDKKYPELQSLSFTSKESSVQNISGAHHSKKSLPSKQERTRNSTLNNESDQDDHFDRLKPPNAITIFSEKRPPTCRRIRHLKNKQERNKNKKSNDTQEYRDYTMSSTKRNMIKTSRHPFSLDTNKKDSHGKQQIFATEDSLHLETKSTNTDSSLLPLRKNKVSTERESTSSMNEPLYETIKECLPPKACSSFPNLSQSDFLANSVDTDSTYDSINDGDDMESKKIASVNENNNPISTKDIPTYATVNKKPKGIAKIIKRPKSERIEPLDSNCSANTSGENIDDVVHIEPDSENEESCVVDSQSNFNDLPIGEYSEGEYFKDKIPTRKIRKSDYFLQGEWSHLDHQAVTLRNRSYSSPLESPSLKHNDVTRRGSISFFVSSGDTPLQHPSSDEDDSPDVQTRPRAPSFKDVMYIVEENVFDDDFGNLLNVSPEQKMTLGMSFDDSVPISMV